MSQAGILYIMVEGIGGALNVCPHSDLTKFLQFSQEGKWGGGERERNPAPGTNDPADLACMGEYVNIPLLNLLEQSCWLFASLSD